MDEQAQGKELEMLLNRLEGALERREVQPRQLRRRDRRQLAR